MNALAKRPDFKISSDYDQEATAIAETAFGTLSIIIVRDEPDCSDDERRAACSMRVEIEKNDGTTLKAKSEDVQFFGHIRDNLTDYVQDAFPDEQSVEDLSKKLQKAANRKLGKTI